MACGLKRSVKALYLQLSKIHWMCLTVLCFAKEWLYFCARPAPLQDLT